MSWKRNILFFIAIGVLVLGFNNCGQFTTTEQWNVNSLNPSTQDSGGADDPSEMPQSQIPQVTPMPPQMTPQPPPLPVVNNGPWPNEPAGMTKIMDCPFSNSLCGLVDTYKSAKFASPGGSGTPRSLGMALDNSLEVNASTGGGQMGFGLSMAKEAYIAMWWSTNSDFLGLCNNGNKLFFVRNSTDNNFLLWQGEPGKPKTLKWDMQATYDNCGHPGEYGMCYTKGDGTGWFEPNGESNGVVAAGSGWHLIEVYLKSSSSKTSRDGALRWALDGKIVGNYPNVNLSPGGFDEYILTHTWDGSSCLVPPYRDMSKAWHHYWDHLYISVR